MGGGHPPLGNARLGMALFAPCLDGKFLGLQDDAGTRDFAWRETFVLRKRDAVVTALGRRRAIDDAGLVEQENGPRTDR